MRAIYKKELRSYFTSMTGYILFYICHCVGVSGVFLGADRIVFLPV